MKKLVSMLSVVMLWPLAASWSQVLAPNEAGVAMGHVHLNVRDVEANKKFWIELGATATTLNVTTVMKFPGVLIFLTPAVASGGNEEAVVNHIGFYLQDFDESVAKWKVTGLKITDEVRRPNRKAAYVFSPDGLRVEIAQNADNASLAVSIVNDHIHFYLAGSAGPEMLSWYAKMFGAEMGIRGANPHVTLPGVRLRFSTSDEARLPTKGRVLDHIGFEVKNLETFCKKLEASGVKFAQPYSKSRHPGYASAELTDPWGTSIELTEGLNRL